MSSEEVLKKQNWSMQDVIPFESMFSVTTDCILSAMSEYAKLDAIAFAEWISDNDWYHNGKHWRKLHDAHYLYTTEQLYELYKSKP